MTFALAIGPRLRLALKIVGYVALTIVMFLYGAHLTFPYDRLKDRGVEALSSKYDVTVGGVERGWLPGDFSLVNVILRTRPAKPTDVPKIIKIDRLDVDTDLLAFLDGRVDVDIDAKIGAGRLGGTISVSKGRFRASLSSKNLSLSDVPGLASVIGMPMGGRGNVKLALDLPNSDWTRATAHLDIECPGCTVGGEGAFFKPRNTNARNEGFVGQGVPVPLIAITNLSAKWTIEKGKIRTDKFEFVSPHVKVELEFEGTMAKDLSKAKVDNACLRYRGTDELKQLDTKFYDALELTGGPLGPDDLRHLKLIGTLGSFRATPRVCGPGVDGVDATDPSGRPRPRPNLSNVPAADGAGPSEGARTTPPLTGPVTTPIGPAPDQPPPQPGIDDVRPAGPAGEGSGAPSGKEPGLAAPVDSGAATGAGGAAGAGGEPPPVRLEEVPREGEPPPPPPPPTGTESASPGNGPPPQIPPPPEE